MTKTEILVAIVCGFSMLIGIYRIYAKSDGIRGMSLAEFQKMMSFFLFYGIIIYMIKTEAERTHEYHIFSDIWMAFAITGLYSALHMDDILDKMTALIEAIVKLSSRTRSTTVESKTEVEVK